MPRVTAKIQARYHLCRGALAQPFKCEQALIYFFSVGGGIGWELESLFPSQGASTGCKLVTFTRSPPEYQLDNATALYGYHSSITTVSAYYQWHTVVDSPDLEYLWASVVRLEVTRFTWRQMQAPFGRLSADSSVKRPETRFAIWWRLTAWAGDGRERDWPLDHRKGDEAVSAFMPLRLPLPVSSDPGSLQELLPPLTPACLRFQCHHLRLTFRPPPHCRTLIFLLTPFFHTTPIVREFFGVKSNVMKWVKYSTLCVYYLFGRTPLIPGWCMNGKHGFKSSTSGGFVDVRLLVWGRC